MQTIRQKLYCFGFVAPSGSRSLGRRVPVVAALPWAQPAARIAYCDTCASLAGLLHHFSGREAPKGTPMMRKAHLDRHLRIVGVARRGVPKFSEGSPMMRKAHQDRHLRIIGVPRRVSGKCIGGPPMMRSATCSWALRTIGVPRRGVALIFIF